MTEKFDFGVSAEDVERTISGGDEGGEEPDSESEAEEVEDDDEGEGADSETESDEAEEEPERKDLIPRKRLNQEIARRSEIKAELAEIREKLAALESSGRGGSKVESMLEELQRTLRESKGRPEDEELDEDGKWRRAQEQSVKGLTRELNSLRVNLAIERECSKNPDLDQDELFQTVVANPGKSVAECAVDLARRDKVRRERYRKQLVEQGWSKTEAKDIAEGKKEPRRVPPRPEAKTPGKPKGPVDKLLLTSRKAREALSERAAAAIERWAK